MAIAPIVKAYREHQAAIHQGLILPIGDEPSGTSWTGFQSISDDQSGYLMIYREFNNQSQHKISLHGLAGKTIRCEPITGHGQALSATVDEQGRVTFTLPQPYTFALYRYSVTR